MKCHEKVPRLFFFHHFRIMINGKFGHKNFSHDILFFKHSSNPAYSTDRIKWPWEISWEFQRDNNHLGEFPHTLVSFISRKFSVLLGPFIMSSIVDFINPCTVELFVSILHSFVAGKADTFSSFK